jgi:hypothetical protein
VNPVVRRAALALVLFGLPVGPTAACTPVSQAAASPTATAVAATASPTASPIFVPNAKAYFPRIDGFDFPTAPSPFIEALTRGLGSEHQTFSSFDGRSVVHDGVQLPAVIASIVISPELYARADTFDMLTSAQLLGLPGAVGRPLTIGALKLPATEITLAGGAGYEVVYLQGFFFVQVIGSDPVLLGQIADVLVAANSRRQP